MTPGTEEGAAGEAADVLAGSRDWAARPAAADWGRA
jgi:hypothetical protein